MLQSIKQLYGDKIGAIDGEIGHIKDFYFDDKNWTVRYVVVDTGSWLPGRKVLLSPWALGRLDPTGKVLRVNLTKAQIEKSPHIDSHKPVSRQYEEEYHKYYGWPYYWQGSALWGASDRPVAVLQAPPEGGIRPAAESSDAHLRSAQAVNGYSIKSGEGTSGTVCDFMIDAETWQIAELVVRTGHRLSGQEVLVPIRDTGKICYEDSTIVVNLAGKTPVQSAVEHLATFGTAK